MRMEAYKRGEKLLMRPEDAADVSQAVAGIIAQVRRDGDQALFELARRFDGAAPDALEVTPAEMDTALAQLDPALRAAMERAAENIRAFHSAQKREGFCLRGAVGT